MERSQLFEPRYSLSTCQFVIVFYQCLPWVLDTNLAENFRFWIYGFCAARAYGPYGWRPYGYVRIRIQITPIWNFYHVTSNLFGILLKLLALNWHSSTLLISIGSGDITDFRRPIWTRGGRGLTWMLFLGFRYNPIGWKKWTMHIKRRLKNEIMQHVCYYHCL